MVVRVVRVVFGLLTLADEVLGAVIIRVVHLAVRVRESRRMYERTNGADGIIDARNSRWAPANASGGSPGLRHFPSLVLLKKRLVRGGFSAIWGEGRGRIWVDGGRGRVNGCVGGAEYAATGICATNLEETGKQTKAQEVEWLGQSRIKGGA